MRNTNVVQCTQVSSWISSNTSVIRFRFFVNTLDIYKLFRSLIRLCLNKESNREEVQVVHHSFLVLEYERVDHFHVRLLATEFDKIG